MQRLACLLLLLVSLPACAQRSTFNSHNAGSSGGGGGGGGTDADTDYTSRCGLVGVISCHTFDLTIPDNPSTPTSGAFPDYASRASSTNTAGVLLDTGHKIGSLPAGSTKLWQLSTAVSGGDVAYVNPKTDTTFQLTPGNDLYIQWRQRFDANKLALPFVSKDYILTTADRYINSTNWGQMKSCSATEIVQINGYRLSGSPFSQPQLLPNLYRHCGPYPGIYPVRSGSSGTLVQNAIGCRDDNVLAHSYTHCWRYPQVNSYSDADGASQWMTFQLHLHQGTDWQANSAQGWHRDSSIELWAAHEGEASQLIISIPDDDLIANDAEDNITGTNRFNGSSVSGWFGQEGLSPGYGRMDFLQYQTDRCGATNPISTVARAGSTVTIGFSGWTDGSGGVACVTAGDSVTVSGVTLDGGSFNGTFTVATASGTTGLTYTQAGNAVSSQASVGSLDDAHWHVTCNSGACDTNTWLAQVIFSQNRITDPCLEHVGIGSCKPDPPDHLAVTAVNNTSGAVTMTWKNNANNQTGYKVYRALGVDFYQADTNLGAGTGAQWSFLANVSNASAGCSAQYATGCTYTDSGVANNSTKYAYYVVATNGNGDSTRSNGANNTPLAPTDVTATAISSTQASVTWNHNPNTEVGDKLYRCIGAHAGLSGSSCLNANIGVTGDWTLVSTVTTCATTHCTYSDSGLSASNTYTYAAYSYNNAGTSSAGGFEWSLCGSCYNTGGSTTAGSFGGNTTAAETTTSAAGATFAAGATTIANTALNAGGTTPSAAYATQASPTPPISIDYCSITSASPCATGSGLAGGGTSRIFSYSGGMADPADKAIAIFGGGHGDYGGDEIYRINVTGTPAVTRLIGPVTGPGKCSNFGSFSAVRYPVQTPTGTCTSPSSGTSGNYQPSVHSYGGPATAPAISGSHQVSLLYGGSLAGGPGDGFQGAWVYDWNTGLSHEVSGSPASLVGNTTCSDISCNFAAYDSINSTSTSAKFYVNCGAGICRLSIDLTTLDATQGSLVTGALATVTGNGVPSRAGMMAFDSTHTKLVFVGKDSTLTGNPKVFTLDVSSNGNAWADVSGSIVNDTTAAYANFQSEWAGWPGVAFNEGYTYIINAGSSAKKLYRFNAADNHFREMAITVASGSPNDLDTNTTPPTSSDAVIYGRLTSIGTQVLLFAAHPYDNVQVLCDPVLHAGGCTP